MGIANVVNKNYCHDCGKKIEIEGEEIKNGVLLAYQDDADKINVFKCHQCFKDKPELTNYKPCEVYSRVVGYLRPVQQWNEGKQREYSERREYKMRENN